MTNSSSKRVHTAARERVAYHLHRIMKERNITSYRAMEREYGIAYKQIYEYCKCITGIRLSTLKSIAQKMGIEVFDLVRKPKD